MGSGPKITIRLPEFESQDPNDYWEAKGSGLSGLMDKGYQKGSPIDTNPYSQLPFAPSSQDFYADVSEAQGYLGLIDDGLDITMTSSGDARNFLRHVSTRFDSASHAWMKSEAGKQKLTEIKSIKTIYDYFKIEGDTIRFQPYDYKEESPFKHTLSKYDLGEVAFDKLFAYVKADPSDRDFERMKNGGKAVSAMYGSRRSVYYSLSDDLEAIKRLSTSVSNPSSDSYAAGNIRFDGGKVEVDISEGIYMLDYNIRNNDPDSIYVADDKLQKDYTRALVAMIRRGYLKDAVDIDMVNAKITFENVDDAQNALRRIFAIGHRNYEESSAIESLRFYLHGAFSEERTDDFFTMTSWHEGARRAIQTALETQEGMRELELDAENYRDVTATRLNRDGEWEEVQAFQGSSAQEAERFYDNMSRMQDRGVRTSYFEFYVLAWDKAEKQAVHVPIVEMVPGQGGQMQPSHALQSFDTVKRFRLDETRYDYIDPDQLGGFLSKPSTFKINDIQTFLHPDYLFVMPTADGHYLPVLRAPVFNRIKTTAGYETQSMFESRRLRISDLEDSDTFRVNMTFDEVVMLDQFVHLVDPINLRQSVFLDIGSETNEVIDLNSWRRAAHIASGDSSMPAQRLIHSMTEPAEDDENTYTLERSHIPYEGLTTALNYQFSFTKNDAATIVNELHSALKASGYPTEGRRDYRLADNARRYWLPDLYADNPADMWVDPIDPLAPPITIRGMQITRRRAAFLEMAFRLYLQDVDTMGLTQQDLFEIQEEMQAAFMAEQNIMMAVTFGGLNLLQVLLPVALSYSGWYIGRMHILQKGILEGKLEKDGGDVDSEKDAEESKKYLSVYGTDLRAKVADKYGNETGITGRDNVISNMIEVMNARGQANSVLLTGDAGIGKTAVVELLAERINKGDVPPSFQNAHLIALDTDALVAGTAYRGQFETRLKELKQSILAMGENNIPDNAWYKPYVNLIKSFAAEDHPSHVTLYDLAYASFVENEMILRVVQEEIIKAKALGRDRLILFIDEIHATKNLGGSREGGGDMWQTLKPLLNDGDLTIIGATTTQEKHIFLDGDAALESRFEEEVMYEPEVEAVRDRIIPATTAKMIRQAYEDDPFLPPQLLIGEDANGDDIYDDFFRVESDFNQVIYDMGPKFFAGGRPRSVKRLAAKYVNHKYIQWWQSVKDEQKAINDEIDKEVELYSHKLAASPHVLRMSTLRKKVEAYRQKISQEKYAEFHKRQRDAGAVIELNREDLLRYVQNSLVPKDVSDVHGQIITVVKEIQAITQMNDQDIGFDAVEVRKLHSADMVEEKRFVDNKLAILKRVKAMVSGTGTRSKEHNRLIQDYMRYVFEADELNDTICENFERDYQAISQISEAGLIDEQLRHALQEAGIPHERYVQDLRDLYFQGEGEEREDYEQRLEAFAARVSLMHEFVEESRKAGVDDVSIRSQMHQSLSGWISLARDEKYGMYDPVNNNDFTVLQRTVSGLDSFFTQDRTAIRTGASTQYTQLYQDIRNDPEGQRIMGEVVLLETRMNANLGFRFAGISSDRFRLLAYRELAEITLMRHQFEGQDEEDFHDAVMARWESFWDNNTVPLFVRRDRTATDEQMQAEILNAKEQFINDLVDTTVSVLNPYRRAHRKAG